MPPLVWLLEELHVQLHVKLCQRDKFPTASPMKHTVKLLPNYTAVEKLGVDAKINTLKSEGKCSPSTESEPSVPVNLTY